MVNKTIQPGKIKLIKRNNLSFLFKFRQPFIQSAFLIIYICFAFNGLIYAAGLNIPNTSTVNVNTGTLNVGGDLDLDGVLQTTTGDVSIGGNVDLDGTFTTTSGTFYLQGNWDNIGGTYTYGTSGTLAFNGTTAQTLNSGGTAVGKRFHNLAQSGSGTTSIAVNYIDIENNLNISAGTLDANGFQINIAGDWANSGSFTHSSGTVVLDGTDQTIAGETTFYNLTKSSSTDTLTFHEDGTQQIAAGGYLTLTGQDNANRLTINSTTNDVKAGLKLTQGAQQNLEFLNVRDNDASIEGGTYPNAVTLVARNSADVGTGSDSTINWIFGAGTLNWDGSVDDDWEDPDNWKEGVVPTSSDSVVILTGMANYPDVDAITGGSVTVNDLTIEASATLTLGDSDLTVNGTLENAGTIILQGVAGQTLSFGTFDDDSGTMNFVGDGNGGASLELPNLSYYNVTLSTSNETYEAPNTGGITSLSVAGDFTMSTSTFDAHPANADYITTIGGSLTVSGGTFNASGTVGNGSLNLDGNFTLNTTGTFTAPDDSDAFTLAGNFSHSDDAATTFTANSGTVSFDGTDQTISGDADTTFYNFSKVLTAQSYTLQFPNTANPNTGNPVVQTITNSLTLTGVNGSTYLFIESDSQGVQADIALQSGATQSLQFLSVRDSDASAGLELVARNSVENPSPSTSNWAFGGTTITWQGDDGGTPTDWETALNWDKGIVPADEDTAVIPDVGSGNDPVLSAAARVEDLTLANGATLTLVGNNLTVDDTLTNGTTTGGTITAYGSENIDITTTDTDSGTFVYNGVGAAAFTIAETGATPNPTAYYNLTINADDSDDTFSTDENLTVYGDLTLTFGELDTSTDSNDVTINGDATINGGTFTSNNSDFDANGSVTVSSGTFSAPATGQSFTVAGDFDTSGGGSFQNNSGQITFDTTASATISGNHTFYDFSCMDSGKTINFLADSIQTISNTFDVSGSDGTEITFQSTNSGDATDRWSVSFTQQNQGIQFVNLKDSDALNNDAYCFSCTNGGNNDNAIASPWWIFNSLSISIPNSGKTVDTTPVIIGTAEAGETVTIKVGAATVGTATAASTGYYRVEVDTTDELTAGSVTLTPYITVGGSDVPGGDIVITASETPTVDQVPTITSHTSGQRINGSTPTIEGMGLTNENVELWVEDSLGNLPLDRINNYAVDAVDGDGDYSVVPTTVFTKGVNYVSVVIDGVSSTIVALTFTDPFGVVFDSVEDNVLQNAVVSLYRAADDQLATVADGDIDSGDSNPQTTGTDGVFAFLAANGNYYIRISIPGYDYPTEKTFAELPAGRTLHDEGTSTRLGSFGETFTVAGAVIEMDQPMDFNFATIRITKDANKKEVRVGDVVTYTLTIENLEINAVSDLVIDDRIPPGFKYLEGRVIKDGVPLSDPRGKRPLKFDVGDLGGNETIIMKYQLVVGAGVVPGSYENEAFAHYFGNTIRISNIAKETVDVVLDPLFDMGNAIGKVFFDRNENGVQDPPKYVHLEEKTITEEPVPNVRIVMEDGTVIKTDKNGMFNVPGILPGRHLFRIDESTLPEGSYLTTDKVVVVDVSPGLMVKVNFGVNIDSFGFQEEDQVFFTKNVNVSQEKDRTNPYLNIDIFNSPIAVYNEIFVEKAEFRIFTNYATFIHYWKLDIVDQDTKKKIKSFEGDRYTIFDPILWDGKDQNGKYIKLDRNYEYILYVESKKRRFDETEPKPIGFKVIENDEALESYHEAQKERQEEFDKWSQQHIRVDERSIKNIVMKGDTIIIDPLKVDLRSVQILKDGRLIVDVPVSEQRDVTAQELLEGEARVASKGDHNLVEVILPKGDYEILVQEKLSGEVGVDAKKARIGEPVQGDGQQAPIKTYSKKVKVGEDYLFFVGMGDAKMGYTFNKGRIEPIQHDPKFEGGFWAEGKMAYYLKGKIKGKYIITSSYDTDREEKDLFKSLDPEEYYPVYGDESSIDYQATDTQGPLYLLIEWDKSSVLWGNYEIGFDETEFSQFSRTLYGGKVDFESLSSTKSGEPTSKIVVFRAKAKQKAAHNEFVATGGSLYYLKHKDVVKGSDKLTIEIRDKITGLVTQSEEMKEGADYELDYDSGRIIFWQPVPILVDAYSIISSELLDGNLVYVVVDYEYAVKDKYDEDSTGARIKQALGDYVTVGGTYVKDSHEAKDYELKGADVKIRIGSSANLTVEYAETESEGGNNYISTDGGLSFTELAVSNDAIGKAYGISGDARLFNKIGVEAFYKFIDNNFSTSATSSQQGKEMYGVKAVYDLFEGARISAQHDVQKLIAGGNLQTALQVGASKSATTLIQIVHELKRLKLTAEYRHQEVTAKKEEFESQTNTEEDTIAARADYQLTDKWGIGVEQQVVLKGEGDTQTTIDATFKPTDKITLKAAKTIGEKGVATSLDAKVDMSGRLQLSGDYTVIRDKTGTLDTTTATTLGAKLKVDEETELTSSIGASDIMKDTRSTTYTFGGTSRVDEDTETTSQIAITESSVDGRETAFTFGTKKKLTEEFELASTQTFGVSEDKTGTESKYSLIRDKDGKQLEGFLSRVYSDGDEEISRTNIFGLTGDVDDKWAVSGSYERGDVQSHDGSTNKRQVLSLGVGYVDKDQETGDSLESSTKLEFRMDDGNADKRQFLFSNATEGKLSEELTIFSKMELSKTRNLTTNETEAQYREIMLGGAFRPIMYDRLNFLARYTYLEDKGPEEQEDINEITEERAHVFALDGIYDITPKWQVIEKFAYRVAEEKVPGFDFAKTHTWLMVHRLNYKFDRDWTLGGEFRSLSQREAEDIKRGFLVEVARNIGEFAQLGVGYNFTDFDDELTDLNYKAQGPFVRLTGKFYDRTDDERERARLRILEERISRWAWIICLEELSRSDSPILEELNYFYRLAEQAYKEEEFEKSRQIYKNIIMAGQLMVQEAAEHVRSQIKQEEHLQELKLLADQYYKNGQYEKAKKILQKILEETQERVIE